MTLRTREIINEQEWLEDWRGGNVNASEMGALFDIDKYTSPLKLYYLKKGEFTVEETDAMRRGRWLEPAVLKATSEVRPDLTITPCKTYYDDPDLRIGCTPDAFATDEQGRKGVVQAKTVGQNVFETWMDESGAIMSPLAYDLQTMVEAIMTKRMDFALISFLVVGYRVDLYGPIQVIPEQRTWETCKRKVKKFWSDFDKGIAPPISPEHDGELVKNIFPGGLNGTLDLTNNNRLPELLEEHEKLAAERSALNASRKPLDRRYEEIRTEIKALIGNYECALLPGGLKATYKPQTNKGWTARVLRISEMK